MNIIKDILEKAHTIAIVGLSPDKEKPSHIVGKYLQGQGYYIIPVNNRHAFILNQKSYPNLSNIPVKVDIVDIFRRPEAVQGIVDEAITIGVGAIWMQEGIINERAAQNAQAAGIPVVMDKCIRKEHINLKSDRLS